MSHALAWLALFISYFLECAHEPPISELDLTEDSQPNLGMVSLLSMASSTLCHRRPALTSHYSLIYALTRTFSPNLLVAVFDFAFTY
jgi:hypothetical protein